MKTEIREEKREFEVYIASDGTEFRDKEDAVWYELQTKAEARFNITCDNILGKDDVFVTVQSQEEVDLLFKYIDEICNCLCYIHPDIRKGVIEYPALLCYDDEGCLTSVSKEKYLDSKKLCNLFEKAKETKYENRIKEALVEMPLTQISVNATSSSGRAAYNVNIVLAEDYLDYFDEITEIIIDIEKSEDVYIEYYCFTE